MVDAQPPCGGLDIEQKLHLCQDRIAYRFQDVKFLQSALTHASGANHRVESNERLEFLGDAILGSIVCEMLYHQFPDYLEGDLTKIKSIVVSRQSCAQISHELGLEEYLILGKGMASNPQVPVSLLSDVFEAILAAIYLDGGYRAAEEFVLRHVAPRIQVASKGDHGGNFKSLLQQHAQRELGTTPTYQLVEEKGPDHAKCFKVTAVISGVRYQAAWGQNKKEAEQRAASNAMAELQSQPIPFTDD